MGALSLPALLPSADHFACSTHPNHLTLLSRAEYPIGYPTARRQRQFAVVILNFDLEHEQDPVRLEHYLTAPVRGAILADYRLASRLEMPGPEKTYPNDRFYAWVPAH
jgi:hypothetical protein